MRLVKSGVLLALLNVFATPVWAGGTIQIADDKSVSVGFGMRASYASSEDGAPNGTSRSQDFSLDSARLYLSGSLNKNIKGMLNTEKDIAGQGFKVIDANGQIQITPNLTLWAGRFLSPSDRANMAGGYYSLGGGYWSGIASRYGYNGGHIGRDDGVALVGSLADGKLGYSFGLFEGNTAFKIAPVTVGKKSGSDSLMAAGRVQVDFLDAEPGYYGTGNYLGSKDILAIGLAGRSQKDGAVSLTQSGKYASYSVDFLFEKKDSGSGSPSIEAAYYDYDTDDVFLSEQGNAYSFGAGYLFNVSVGKLQPIVRYQRFNSDANIDTRKYDVGVNYILDGYNAQFAAFYSDTQSSGTSGKDAFTATMQLQY